MKQNQMRPFVIFTGVKDNPIPYEKKYRQKHNVELKAKLEEYEKAIKPKDLALKPAKLPGLFPKIKAVHGRNRTMQTTQLPFPNAESSKKPLMPVPSQKVTIASKLREITARNSPGRSTPLVINTRPSEAADQKAKRAAAGPTRSPPEGHASF